MLTYLASQRLVTVATWCGYRRALEVHQKRMGFHKAAQKIRQLNYPQEDRKKRPNRCKQVDQETHKILIDDANKRSDYDLLAALVIANALGVRPAEISGIKVMMEKYGYLGLFIPGAKKTDRRGMDKKIIIPYDEQLRMAIKIVLEPSWDIRRAQWRLYSSSKRLFPGCAAVSLYSYRHQLGSDLKADSSIPDKVKSAIMGHLSTQSISVYGRPKNGRKKCLIMPTQSNLDKVSTVSPTKAPPLSRPEKNQRCQKNRSHFVI